MLLFTLVGLAFLCIYVVPTVFFTNQNDIDNNIVVAGPSAGSFNFFKDQGHMIAAWIGSLGPMTGIMLLCFAVLIVILAMFALARRNSA